MHSLLFLGFSSLLLALFLTPRIRDTALRFGLVDRPDGVRRLHHSPIPTLGGVAVILSYLGALLGLLLVSALASQLGLAGKQFAGAGAVWAGIPVALTLLPAMATIFATGILDDLTDLEPWQKFAGQFMAAGLAYWNGIRISNLAGFELEPWLGLVVTLVWLVGCSNAFNLIDGMDGLAAGAGAFATGTILFAALMTQNFSLALVCVPLAGALIGFLRYNFNPASIFLGDSGSLLIGFLLGSYSVLWSQKSTAVLGMTAPLMAMALPLVDTFLAITRRFLRHRPILRGDRDHIHHRLLANGLTPKRAVLVLYGACAIAASFTLLGLAAERRDLHGLAILLFVVCACVGINRLGYREFGVARRLILQGAFQRQVQGRIAVEKLDMSLGAAKDTEESWQAILAACEELGFLYAELRMGDCHFRSDISDPDPSSSAHWQAVIPVGDGWLELRRRVHDNSGPNPSLSNLSEVITRRLGLPAAPDGEETPFAKSLFSLNRVVTTDAPSPRLADLKKQSGRMTRPL